MNGRVSNDELLERSRTGDIEAFGELVREHQGWLRGMLRGRLRDWAAADDLAQDAFVTAFRKIRQFRGDSKFETWLRGIAMNHLRNFVRKRREECIGGSEELEVMLERGCREESLENPALDALRECLAGVEGPARELLDTRYVVGKTVREIATESGRGYSALTMQLHRLRAGLADCVEKKLATTEG